MDQHRQWFKAHYGLAARETPREFAFCAHAILQDEVFLVPDADNDARFADNLLVAGDPHVKFYAGVPLKFGRDLPMGTLCVIDHQSRQLERDQITALEALGRQVESQFLLRRQVRQLQENERHKEEFVSMVSHELRTPLTSIGGSLALLVDCAVGALPDSALAMINVARSNSERLVRLVIDILDLAKMESGDLEFKNETLEVTELVRLAVAANQGFASEYGVQFEVGTNGRLAMVTGDSDRLTQVLANLLSNAVKFSPPEKPVTVDVQQADSMVCVSVHDDGPGIPEAFHDRVFDRFAQADSSTRRKVAGTGLGLAIAKEIVERYGGTIGFESAPGAGTTFKLPLRG